MKLEQIEQFNELAKTGNINRAAKNLYMSQPNLSRSIKHLEEEIGVELFIRTVSGVQLTSYGREFWEYTRSVQCELDALDKYCDSCRLQKRLSFFLVAPRLKWIEEAFLQYTLKYEKAPIHFSLYSLEDLSTQLELLQTNQADLCITVILQNSKKKLLQRVKTYGLEYNTLITGQTHIAVGPKNPLYYSEAKNVTPERLADFPLGIYGGPHKSYYQSCAEALGLDTSASNIIRINSVELMYRLIAESSMITYETSTPDFYHRTPFYNDIKLLPLAGKHAMFEIGWLKQRTGLSQIAAEFIDELTEIIS